MTKTTQVEFKNIFQLSLLLIFSAVLIATLIDQSLNQQIDHIIRSTEGLSNMIWIWGSLSLVSALIFPLLISFLCAQTLANAGTSFTAMMNEKFELGLIETLRAWGKTFLWCFVFIIPGLIKFTYYLMAPFVVFFSKKYADGEVDALEYSTQISKKFWWRLNFWLTLFYALIPLALSSFLDEYRLFNVHPVSAIFCVVLETALVLAFHYFILKLFLKYLKEFETGESVSQVQIQEEINGVTI